MDSATRQLVNLAMDTQYATLHADVVHQSKRRLIDTFACAMGSYAHPLSATVRQLAGEYSGTTAASVWGSGARSSAEMAAFANGVMLRVGENSDTFIGAGGGGHPSDMMAALVAVAESSRASGQALIEAIVIAYDVYCGLMESARLGAKGWDQVVHVVLGATLGAGKLMGLNREQLGHAVALALTPNMALRQTRHGQLSNWKGCAGANASRNAVFAAKLASLGMEGPQDIFEGKQGLWAVTERFDLPAEAPQPRMVTRTSIKSLPVCYHTQSAALAALDLRVQVDLANVEDIHVQTYQSALEMAAGDPGQWTPQTQESADHSLPFVVATALARGSVAPECFAPERLKDEPVLALMKKVRVTEESGLSAQWPVTAPARVTIRHGGKSATAEVIYPKGHVLNPMTDAELAAKFSASFEPLAGRQRCDRALSALWRLDGTTDLATGLLEALAVTQPG